MHTYIYIGVAKTSLQARVVNAVKKNKNKRFPPCGREGALISFSR